jgi:maltooligosyltrehalose trehalohydrolase
VNVGFELAMGARPSAEGGVQFRLWAPKLERVDVELCESGERIAMQRDARGLFSAHVPAARPGDDYYYLAEGDRKRPDPVSRFQPRGVHGPSRIVDPNDFAWSDGEWRGIERSELLIYELHIGTFTTEGTFDSAISRLSYLSKLGITAIEVMPIAEFPGARNWGYDGAQLYAPHSAYGGPNGFKRFVDACHSHGMAVLLDVVYNHLGPEGNYLPEFGPYFTERYRTPWGPALNFDDADCEPVRRYFIDNALYWLCEYHVDGLRLDAVHAIYDFGAEHVLSELAREFHDQAARLARKVALIAESDLNDTRVLGEHDRRGWQLDAQWSDDFHHALHSLMTGTRHGYFADFGRLADLRKALTEGFVYDRRYSAYRRRRHGNSAASIPGDRFVVFNQNHDQIANASGGARIGQLLSADQQRLALAILICSPNLVLLFMGQEYGELVPFHYFTSHTDPKLARAVQDGRKAEYLAFSRELEFADPQAEQTFWASKLDWAKLERPEHARMLDYHMRLLRVRREYPCLSNCNKQLTRVEIDEKAGTLVMQRDGAAGTSAILVCNLSSEPRSIPVATSAAPYRLELETSESAADGPGDAGTIPAALTEESSLKLGPWRGALYLLGPHG